MSTQAPRRPDPPESGVPMPGRLLRRVPVGLRVSLLAVGIATAFALTLIIFGDSLSSGAVQDWIDDSGVVAPIAFLALASALNAVGFPGPLLNAAAGALFGTALGVALALTATTLSALIAFSIGRWVAGDAVAALGGPRLRALAAVIERHGFLSVLTVRIIPGVPFALVNYAAGLTRLSIFTFALATAIGTAPRTFAYTALGGSFGDFTRPEAIIAAAVLVVMAIGGLLTARVTLRRARRRPTTERDSTIADLTDCR